MTSLRTASEFNRFVRVNEVKVLHLGSEVAPRWQRQLIILIDPLVAVAAQQANNFFATAHVSPVIGCLDGPSQLEER